MEAAERFAAGEDAATVAKAVLAHVGSVQHWRAAWIQYRPRLIDGVLAGTSLAHVTVLGGN